MRNYLLESYESNTDRGSSGLTNPTGLDYSSYKILNASLQNVRLAPIKPQDRIKQTESKAERPKLPPIETNIARYPAHMNSRNRFDVTKSMDVSLQQKYRDANQSLSIGEVAGTQVLIKWGFDGYDAPITNHRYKVNNTIETYSKKRNFAELEASSKKWIPAPHHLDPLDWKMSQLGPSDKS